MPTHKPDLSALNIGQLAALVRCKPQTMRRRLDGLEPVQTSGRERLYDSADALDRYYTGETMNLSRERARLARAQSVSQERRNEIARGEVVPVTEIALVGATFLNAVKMRVMGLRTLGPLIRAAGSDAEAAEILDSGARDALSELAGMGDLAREVAGPERKRGGNGADRASGPA